MSVLFTNNASAQLASGISNASTTIVVAAGQGTRFPAPTGSDYFYATLVNPSNELEIVKVTARTDDNMTVVRGQDGTSARAYNAGDLIEMRPVAAVFEDFQNYIPLVGADWAFEQVGNDLHFKYQGVVKLALKPTGELVAVGDVVTDGTI